MAPKYRLMTPGPTQVPEAALLAMARQLPHHRTPEFRAVLAEVFAGLKEVFATQNDVLMLASSGTGAMEAAVVNTVGVGDKAIVLESGKFSERWRELCAAFGAQVVSYSVPWGEPFAAQRVAELLREHADAVAVFGTLMETSTGVAHDIEAIGRVVGASSALFVVDAISAAGAMECRTDAWNIDLLAVGGQKGLMAPPGLAFLAVSEAAWKRIESRRRPAFYFDLLAYRKALANCDTPFTPATGLVLALAENLRLLRQEGVEQVWTRCDRSARAARAGLTALGLKLFPARPASAMTMAWLPDGVDGPAFLQRLATRFGVKLAGGQGPVKGKVFRIAHMGILDDLEILAALAAIELVLVEFGQPVKLGAAVTAASHVIHGSS